MTDHNDLKHLRTVLQHYVVVYVEDNVGLNAQATELFKKFFNTVISAYDGEEGLRLVEQHHPQIVITDINMPKMDGLSMAESILKIDPDVKIIITTAHDELDFLHRAIKIGIFDYLAKPIRIDNLVETFTRCAEELKEEFHRRIFNANLHTIFNYQNNLVILLNGRNAVMANQPALDFFGTSAMEAFRKKFASFGELLLAHNTFLYNHDGIEWFSHMYKHPKRLFNVKIADQEDVSHHFILSFQTIPEKEGYSVISLNDVTELELLKLYDSNALEREKVSKDTKMIRGLLEMAMRSGAKVRVHNFYKGLSITNEGLITEVNEKYITLKAPYVQLKAIQYENEFYITSELFPMVILCGGIKRMEFEAQNVVFETYKMASTSPTRRQAIRVVPDQDMKVTLLYEGRKFDTDIIILDVSLKAIRVQLPTLPSGFALNVNVLLDMVISSALRPIIINTPATVFRIAEVKSRYEVVCQYDLHGPAQKSMIDYVAKRQMVLIREFKGLQNEK